MMKIKGLVFHEIVSRLEKFPYPIPSIRDYIRIKWRTIVKWTVIPKHVTVAKISQKIQSTTKKIHSILKNKPPEFNSIRQTYAVLCAGLYSVTWQTRPGARVFGGPA